MSAHALGRVSQRDLCKFFIPSILRLFELEHLHRKPQHVIKVQILPLSCRRTIGQACRVTRRRGDREGTVRAALGLGGAVRRGEAFRAE